MSVLLITPIGKSAMRNKTGFGIRASEMRSGEHHRSLNNRRAQTVYRAGGRRIHFETSIRPRRDDCNIERVVGQFY
jgi:hypothetical protein